SIVAPEPCCLGSGGRHLPDSQYVAGRERPLARFIEQRLGLATAAAPQMNPPEHHDGYKPPDRRWLRLQHGPRVVLGLLPGALLQMGAGTLRQDVERPEVEVALARAGEPIGELLCGAGVVAGDKRLIGEVDISPR